MIFLKNKKMKIKKGMVVFINEKGKLEELRDTTKKVNIIGVYNGKIKWGIKRKMRHEILENGDIFKTKFDLSFNPGKEIYYYADKNTHEIKLIEEYSTDIHKGYYIYQFGIVIDKKHILLRINNLGRIRDV